MGLLLTQLAKNGSMKIKYMFLCIERPSPGLLDIEGFKADALGRSNFKPDVLLLVAAGKHKSESAVGNRHSQILFGA